MSVYRDVLVKGAFHRGASIAEAAESMKVGTILRLEREPENKFDSFAIKVFYEALWIGYIEKGQAAWIAPDMDEGDDYVAELTGYETVGAGKGTTYPVVTVRPND